MPYLGFLLIGQNGGTFRWPLVPLPWEASNVNTILYSLSGALFQALLMQTALAAGKMRLYKDSLVPTVNTPLADFVTAEADFTGYPSGGATVTAWLDPILSPISGYQITAPISQFVCDNPTTVGNVIGGWFYVETGGSLICFGAYATGQAMQVPDAGLDVGPTLTFPTGG